MRNINETLIDGTRTSVFIAHRYVVDPPCPASSHDLKCSMLIFALNRLRTIADADLIIVLRDGQVAEQGTHTELMSIQGGVYQDLWNAQLQDSITPAGEGEEIVVESKA